MKLIIEILLSLFIVFATLEATKYMTKHKRDFVRNCKLLHPNSISILRIPLSFLAVYLFAIWQETFWIALFVFASITDASDWIIARKCWLTTELGKNLDPLSDKIVYFVPLIYFAFLWKIPFYLVAIFLIIDTFWQFSRIILRKLQLETKANSYWKFKTTFVFILIFYLMSFEKEFSQFLPFFINNILMILAIFFAILSIVFKFIPWKK